MNGEAIRVLLVEDTPGDVRLVQENLIQSIDARFKITHADRLAKALASLKEERFDVILLDLSLPDAQGLDSLVRVRTEAPGTPIVILTGLNDEQVATKAIQEGAQDYLVKGRISSELLAHVIAYAVERKQAEASLRQSEEKYRDLFETMAQGVVYHDAEGKIISANPAAEQILGLTLDQMQGRSPLDPRWRAIHEDGSDFPGETHPTIVALKRGEAVKNVVMGVFHPKEEAYRWIHINAVPQFKPGDEKPYQVYATFADMTERREAEEALRNAKEFSENLIQTANVMILSLDPLGKVHIFNQAAEKITGYSLSELKEKSWFETLVPKDRYPHVWKEFNRLLSGGMPQAFENPILTKSGEERYIIWQNNQVRVDGKIVSTISFGNDITERKRAEEALQSSEERFRKLAEAAPMGIFLTQPTGECVYTNPVWTEISGRSAEESAGYGWMEAIHPDDRANVAQAWHAAAARGENYSVDYRVATPARDVLWVHVLATPQFDASGTVVCYVGSVENITERKRAEELLHSRALRQAVLAELGQRALSGLPHQELMNEAVSRSAEILGVEFCKLLEPLPDGTALLLRAGVGWKPGLVGQTTVGMWENSQAAYTLATNGPVVVEDLQAETRFLAPTLLREHGVVSGLSVLISGQDYPYGVLGVHTARRRRFTEEDVHFLQAIANILATAIDRKKAEERIEHQAYHDALTGLPNRLLLEDRLSVAVAQAHRNGEILAILLIDLDRFKVINDTLGHPAGDEMLRAVGARFLRTIREGDTVSRMGGDEFAVLLPNLNSDEAALEIADRIAASLREPFPLEGRDLFVTASMGVAVYPHAGVDGRTLLQHADIALYRAKEQGRNTLRFFSPAMNSRAVERLSLESSLRQALQRREFLLHYQPQVDLKSGEIIGFEALIRWHRPEIGMISPAEFIPLAEETGLILPIGEWVLRTACAQNKAWQEAGFPPMRIAVNLSARQFHRENLVDTVTRALQESGLAPEYLELELTESILMGKETSILHMLRELTEMGIQLSIDDFGTGYSSLAYLKRFPIAKLKVDQIFVQNLTTDPNDAVIVKTVVGMAHSLRLKAIAEGVETEGQLAYLRSIGCEEMQGYLFSRPLPAEEATKLLVQKKRL